MNVTQAQDIMKRANAVVSCPSDAERVCGLYEKRSPVVAAAAMIVGASLAIGPSRVRRMQQKADMLLKEYGPECFR